LIASFQLPIRSLYRYNIRHSYLRNSNGLKRANCALSERQNRNGFVDIPTRHSINSMCCLNCLGFHSAISCLHIGGSEFAMGSAVWSRIIGRRRTWECPIRVQKMEGSGGRPGPEVSRAVCV
jgi:hypothetical protein